MTCLPQGVSLLRIFILVSEIGDARYKFYKAEVDETFAQNQYKFICKLSLKAILLQKPGGLHLSPDKFTR